MLNDVTPIRRDETGRIRHIDVPALMQYPDGFALLRDALDEVQAELPQCDTLDEPPWLVCPDTTPDSLLWKVKRGAALLKSFVSWYSGLGPDLRRHVRERYPEPRGWLGFYDSLA